VARIVERLPPPLRPAAFVGDALALDRFTATLKERGWRVAAADDAAVDLMVAVDPTRPARAAAGLFPIDPADRSAVTAAARLGAVLVADGPGLWRWWRPGRLPLDLARIAGEPGAERAIDRIAVGRHWTVIAAGERAGMAQTPDAATADYLAQLAPAWIGRTLAWAARHLAQGGPLTIPAQAALGAVFGAGAIGVDQDGLADLDRDGGAGTIVIGRFPDLAAKLPAALVVERHPDANELAAEEAIWRLPAARRLIATSSTLANGTLPALMAANPDLGATLVGPGTPLTTRAHDYGVTTLAGFAIEDVDLILAGAKAGLGFRALAAAGRRVTLTVAGTAYSPT
jgi:hypothetical protein